MEFEAEQGQDREHPVNLQRRLAPFQFRKKPDPHPQHSGGFLQRKAPLLRRCRTSRPRSAAERIFVMANRCGAGVGEFVAPAGRSGN